MSTRVRARRRGARAAPHRLLAWTLPGALLGVLLSRLGGGGMERPIALSKDEWDVVSPALDESLKTPDLGRGCSIAEGALIIRRHAFHRSDILSHRDTLPLAELDIMLHEDSGPVSVVLRGDGLGPPLFLHLTAHAFYNDASRVWTERKEAGPWIVRIREGYATLDSPDGEVRLGAVAPGKVEFTADTEEVRIRQLRLVDVSGAETLRADFASTSVSAARVVAMAVAGAVLGTLASFVGSPIAGVILALPALAVPLVSSGTWLAIVERLYLVSTPNWLLARLAWAAALLPLAGGALLGSGLLSVPPRSGWKEWVLRAAPGLALLPLQPTAWLGLLWLVLLVVANAQSLLREHPGRAANGLFLAFLLFPLSLEWAIRWTYLSEGWDAARLSGEAAPTVAWKTGTPFWSDQCGRGEAATTRSLVFTGGSSVGGAYQFRGEPDAFFPARVLAKLCDSAPEGIRYKAANYGDGGRDSYTVSRAIEAYMARSGHDLVVYYGGVNDLLTTNNTLTRKQREAREAERNAAVSGLAALAASSRLITGISLPFHPPDAASGAHVQDVPLPDAEENLRMLADKVGAAGGKLLLTTEYVRDDNDGLLRAYAQLEERIAAEYPHVSFTDLKTPMDAFSGEELLVDRNHLSRGGADHLADVMLPAVTAALAP